jgi:two-component system, LytTR family, response regulator
MNINSLRSVIIEDEEESLQLLHNLIVKNGLTEVAGSTTDPDKALSLILATDPDIVFIDIKMPGKSGFEILDDLRKIPSLHPYIVFTTAYNEFAIKAFEYAAFDYLLKPIEPARLADTIMRGIDASQSGMSQKTDILLNSLKKLMFRNQSGIVFIDHDEIIYIEAEGNYSVFHLGNNKTETVTMNLGKVEEQLPPQHFCRISRSFIINISYLKRVNTKQMNCILTKNGNDFKCDISRERIPVLVEMMKSR